MVKDSKRRVEKGKKSKEKIGGSSDEEVAPKVNSSVLVTAVPSTAAQIVMKRFAVLTVCKGIDGILKEFSELKAVCQKPDPSNRSSFDKNAAKNRYKDIFCLEANRVLLNWPPDDPIIGGCDYIHANWVSELPDMPRKIICTQGPMENTTVDFWRMIWQEKCSSILMLCSVMENEKKKCEQYWPEKGGEKMKIANLTIKNLEVLDEGEVRISKLVVYGKGSDGTLKEHIVVHVQWTGWPDKSVPISAVGAIRAIVRTQNFSPLVVHCSAGVGRTGTVVAIEASLRMLLAGREVSIYNILKEIRSRRYLACQTDLQYLYVHRAILAYITSKKVMTNAEVSKFVDDYTELVNKRKSIKTVDQ